MQQAAGRGSAFTIARRPVTTTTGEQGRRGLKSSELRRLELTAAAALQVSYLLRIFDVQQAAAAAVVFEICKVYAGMFHPSRCSEPPNTDPRAYRQSTAVATLVASVRCRPHRWCYSERPPAGIIKIIHIGRHHQCPRKLQVSARNSPNSSKRPKNVMLCSRSSNGS